jgi:cytosine/adenosine deaminase-related metal-dependent hydrolase
MGTLLVRNADLLVTMGDDGAEIAGGGLFAVDGVIAQVGPSDALPATADELIDARGMLIMPGLVNTHHHFCQTLTRCMAQDQNLFGWLSTLYPIWSRITPEAVYTATRTALAELLLSGCTTSSDHTYLWPNGARLDDQIHAAQELGVRFHAARGSMSVGQSKGGLPPDHVVEDETAILADSRRLIEQYHDPRPGAMLRIVLAPCSPFTVSLDLMRESLALARSYGVHSHTHLAETLDEERYCLERFGRRPVELIEDLGWVGADVWHAHVVHPSADEVGRLGATRTGLAHCPCSNMRLASGIAPIGAMRRAGWRVGLGVDGSASNDGAHMLGEARQAMLLQRVGGDPAALSAREALWLATRGGAEVLGRDEIGQLAVGKCADIVGYRLDQLGFAGGAIHDPVAALVFCYPPWVDLSVVHGRTLVRGGELLGIDLVQQIERHNAIARALVDG